jgi:hypothetical protein
MPLIKIRPADLKRRENKHQQEAKAIDWQKRTIEIAWISPSFSREKTSEKDFDKVTED